MRKYNIVYFVSCTLYFLLFVCIYIFVKSHFVYYDVELEEYEGNILLSNLAGGILFTFWMFSSKNLSDILKMRINPIKRKRMKMLKEQYRSINTQTIEDELNVMRRASCMFSYGYINEESERKCRDHADILFVREYEEKVRYLKDNIPIWIFIALIFFIYGYMW